MLLQRLFAPRSGWMKIAYGLASKNKKDLYCIK
jgi:hypothetical protein